MVLGDMLKTVDRFGNGLPDESEKGSYFHKFIAPSVFHRFD